MAYDDNADEQPFLPPTGRDGFVPFSIERSWDFQFGAQDGFGITFWYRTLADAQWKVDRWLIVGAVDARIVAPNGAA